MKNRIYQFFMASILLLAGAQLMAQSTQTGTAVIDISGINSWDLEGSPNNEIATLLIDEFAAIPDCNDPVLEITGLAWDVNQQTVGASWLSEMTIGIDANQDATGDIFLSPSATNSPGSETNSSGGNVPITALISNATSGSIDIEFFESFDDVSGAVDGFFDTGSQIVVEYTLTCAPPPPPYLFTESCSADVPLTFDPPATASAATTVASSAAPADTGIIGTGLGEYVLYSANINLEHQDARDVILSVQSPSGTIVTMMNGNGDATSLDTAVDLILSDQASANISTWTGGAPDPAGYQPLNDFASAFAGEDINGDWFLLVEDVNTVNQNAGVVNSFCLTFALSAGDPPTIFCPADFVADNDEGVCGAVANFAPPVAFDANNMPLDPSAVVQTDGLPTGSEFPVGDNDVTFTATDTFGNETSCTFVITILDAEAPMAVCQAFTVTLDETGNGSMMDADIDGGSTDNCAVDSVVASQTAFTCADVGEVTVTLEVFDAAGNSSICEAIVTVVDETAPVIVCIGEQMNSVGGTGGAGEDISVGLPPVVSVISVTEDLEILDVNVDLNINHTWTGDLTITLESPAGTSVTIFDGPADGCSSDDIITMLDDESANSFDCLGQDGFPDADYMPSNSLDSFDGEMSMGDWTLTVADGVGGDDGNLNSWGITIGIEPIAAPPYEVDLNADGTATVLASDLIDSVDEACGYSVTVAGEAAGSSLSTTFANDNGGAVGGAVYFDVTVGATELSLESIDVHTAETAAFDMEVFAIVGGTYVGNEGDASAWTSIGTSSGTGLGLGTPSPTTLGTAVTLAANTTYAMALVMDANASHAYTNGDGSNEAFSNADLSIALGAASNVPFDGSPFAPRVWNGTLNYTGGAPSGSLELMLDCSNLGENIVEVIVTDDSGNVSTCMATVVVSDVTAPVLVCEDTTIELGEDGTYTIDPLDLIASLPDDYYVISIGSDNGSLTEGNTDLTVDVTEAASVSFDWDYQNDDDPTWDSFGYLLNGTYTILTDGSGPTTGNTSVSLVAGDEFGFRSQSLDGSFGAGTTTITNFMPGFTGQFAPENWTETLDNSDGSATFVLIPGGTQAFDACGIDVLIADLEMVTCDDIGTPITVTVFATDASGNVSSCTTVVTVVDAMAPVLTCPEDQSIMVDPNGSHTLADYIGDGAATATDNCTDPVTDFTQDPAPGTILGVGVHIITFTATDEYGNVSTCEMELDLTILGTQDNELNNAIALYPNPANGQVTIANSSNIALETAMIYDLNGKLVSQINLQDMQSEKVIDVSAYATGVYMVYITGEQSSVVKRLIKE